MVRGSNFSGVATFFTPVQTGLAARPYTRGTRTFLRVKQPERGDDHPHASSAKVKETVQLYIYPPYGTPWPVLGRILTFYRLLSLAEFVIFSLLFFQALFMSSLSFKFSKNANLFGILI
jgi:hypothetical protein